MKLLVMEEDTKEIGTLPGVEFFTFTQNGNLIIHKEKATIIDVNPNWRLVAILP